MFLKADRTAARPPKPTIRRTLSLDTIVGPYLQGQWPKEAEGAPAAGGNDKATQVNAKPLDQSWRFGVIKRNRVRTHGAACQNSCPAAEAADTLGPGFCQLVCVKVSVDVACPSLVQLVESSQLELVVFVL